MVGGRISCCFAARKFKTIRRISNQVKLTVEHNLTVGKPKILYILPNADLTKVHSVVKPLLAGKIIPVVPLAGFLSKLFFVGKGNEGLLLSHHSEGTKQTYLLPKSPNGRFALPKIHVATRRLHVQPLLKRCLLFSLIEQRIRVNDTLSMVR